MDPGVGMPPIGSTFVGGTTRAVDFEGRTEKSSCCGCEGGGDWLCGVGGAAFAFCLSAFCLTASLSSWICRAVVSRYPEQVFFSFTHRWQAGSSSPHRFFDLRQFSQPALGLPRYTIGLNDGP